MENSKILLERALQILRLGQVPQDQWAAGGGTILKEYFGHRLSKDIDIFIDDVQYLSALSSRCNDEATEALDYVETGRLIVSKIIQKWVFLLTRIGSYDIFSASINNLRGCNGLDGGSWCMGSEPGGHHPVSKVKLLLNIKANEDYALAA